MKSFRVKAGLSQEKTAELLGIARNTLVYYEKKPYSIPLETFLEMINIYGEDFRDVFIAEKLYKR